MKYLMTQEEFEEIMGKDGFTAIYFGATWCGPCRNIDTDRLDKMSINWYKCDVDQNSYTPGYCSIKAIPSFIVIADGKAIGPLREADTDAVMEWVTGAHANWRKSISPK